MERNDFLRELFALINKAHDENVPMPEVYGSLGMAQTKMENDVQEALSNGGGFDTSEFKKNDDEEFY